MFVNDVMELGINVKMDVSKGNLVYELKIPLLRSESQPYGIGTEMANIIGIGLESGKIDVEEMRSQTGSQGGGMGGRGGGRGGKGGMGGMGGRGGGDHGGMGGQGGMGRMRPQMPESLELWLKIQLASEIKIQ